MSSGKVFWGVFLATIGVLLLLENFNILVFNFDYLWDYWPILLILWGVSLLFRGTVIRPVFSGLAAVILALMIFSFFTFHWWNDGSCSSNDDSSIQEYSADFKPAITTADLSIKGGIGRFTIDGVTDKLYEVKTVSPVGWYSVTDRTDNTSASVSVEMNNHEEHIKFGKMKNTASIKLNDKPLWNIDVHAGASKADLNLSPFALGNVTIETGASRVNVRIGEKADKANIRVECGVSSVRIEVPEALGVEIRTDTGLSSKRFENCKRVSDGLYQSDNFSNSTKKVYVEIKGGVSSFSVSRY
jgi:hypothetical protein